MRFRGTMAAARNTSLMGLPCGCGMGALPENLQNPLYAVGSQNSHYKDVINEPLWDQMRTYATPYPPLPYAGPGVQNPWGTAGSGTPFLIDSGSASTPASGGRGGGGIRRVNLSGLGDSAEVAAFPYPNKNPDVTGNTFWYTGQPVLNAGAPRYSNDAAEWLRHAVVDSNWDDVEVWMAWALNNGMTPAQLQQVDFGRYKFTSGVNGAKKFYPFSEADYNSFFDRFMRYASNVQVNQDCLAGKRDLYRRAVRSNPRNSYQLNLSDCPLTTPWYIGLMRAVAVLAIPVALAGAATLIAGAGAAGATGGVVGTAGAAGAGTAGAGATALIPAGIEVVTVAATPIVGVSVGTTIAAGLTAGAVAIAAAPPPLSPPQVPAPAPAATIETVTTTASTLPAASVGQAITAGAVATATTAPALLSPSIETVTVERPRIEQHPVSAAETAATGLVSVGIQYPEIKLTPPQAPEYQHSVTDQIKSDLQDAAGSLGTEYLKNHLQEWLANQLGRDPTPGELQHYEDYLQPNTPGALLRRALPWIVLAIAAVLIVSSKKRGAARRKVTAHHVAHSLRAAGGRRI